MWGTEPRLFYYVWIWRHLWQQCLFVEQFWVFRSSVCNFQKIYSLKQVGALLAPAETHGIEILAPSVLPWREIWNGLVLLYMFTNIVSCVLFVNLPSISKVFVPNWQKMQKNVLGNALDLLNKNVLHFIAIGNVACFLLCSISGVIAPYLIEIRQQCMSRDTAMKQMDVYCYHFRN